MTVSLAGVLVCCAILLMSRFSAQPLIFALISSLAFGSTAIVILSAIGGSSPIMYVVFLCALLAAVALRPNVVHEICAVFARQPTAWILLFLILHVIAGAILLPRLFAGETTVFVPLHDEGRMGAIPLAPVSGNLTQALYFVLGATSYFALSVLLVKPRAIVAIRQGFFTLCTLHVSMGLIDFGGKLAGLGDVLAPIRTAAYSMLTQADVAGFSRIAGAYSEASAFGSSSVALLAFTFTYWRLAQSRYAMLLTVTLFVLLVLSTSSTAYVGGGVLGLVVIAIMVSAVLRDRLRFQDILLLVAGFAGLTALLGIVLYNEHALDPLWRLFQTMVIDKASSGSAQERGYWNYMSLQSVLDTSGLGIGIGSSRASSWIIAVASQLGVIGTVLIGLLVLRLIKGANLRHADLDLEDRVTILSVRAASLAALMAACIGDGSANPGMLFFIALATVDMPLRATSAGRYVFGRVDSPASTTAQVGFHPGPDPVGS